MVVAIFALQSILMFVVKKGEDATDESTKAWHTALHNLDMAEVDLGREQLAAYEVIFGRGLAEAGRFAAAAAGVEKNLSEATGAASSPELEDLLDQISRAHGEAGQIFTGQVIPAAGRGDTTALEAAKRELFKRYELIGGRIPSVRESFESRMAEAMVMHDDAEGRTELILGVSALATIILVLLVLGLSVRSMTGPLKKLVRANMDLADGDLSRRVEIGGSDELARLGASFNRMAGELERSTRALEEEEAKARSIHQGLSDGLIILDERGAIESANPAAESVLERPVVELKGNSSTGIPELDRALDGSPRLAGRMIKCWEVKNCTHQDCPSYQSEDRRCWLQCGTYCHDRIQGTFKQKRDACERCDVFRADVVSELKAVAVGDRYYDIILSPLLDDRGREEGRTIVFRDITETNQAHKELAALDHLGQRLSDTLDLEELLETTAASLMEVFPAEGIAIHLGRRDGDSMALALRRGLSAGVAEEGRLRVGREGGETELIDDLRETAVAHEAARKEGIRSYLRVPLKSKARTIGTLVLVSRQAGAFSGRDRHLLALMGDRAGAAIANQELFERVRKAKSEWETTFDAAGEGIMVISKDHVITRLNKAAAEMLGGTVESIIGSNCYQLVHKSDALPDGCLMAAACGSGGNARGEEERPDGHTLEMVVDIIRDDDGEVTGSVHFLRDITEAKRLRRQLLQAEKMVSIGQLVSGVAHEINNPLTGITGYAQLLAMKELDEDIRKDIESINREAERAARIVKNLLSFAREHKLEKRLVNIDSIIRESLELKAYDLRVNNISVQTEMDEGLSETTADSYQLQQVFLNLIANAEQAMLANHGSGNLKVSTREEDGVIRVVFADDGPGVPEDIRNRVFDPFFTTKEVGVGTGLGLSICYGIIEEHGGSIRLEPSGHRGAVFVIELPVTRGAVDMVAEQQPPEASTRPGKILLVDDEAVVRDVLAKTLKRSGHTVDTARNGKVALRMLDRHQYDCVVSDIRMPEMNGAALHRIIRQRDPEMAGRFIFITGDTVSPETRKYLEQVDNPRLAKPFNAYEFKRELEKVLGNN